MSDKRRFLFVPLGSAGDVHPLVWLARLMAARGHEVAMVAQAVVADIPQRAGLRTVPVGSPSDHDHIISNPDLWHPDRGFRLLARGFPNWTREMIPAIRAEIAPGRTVLVGGGIAFAARITAEAFRVPLVTVQLQPQVFMSADDAPVMRAGLEWLKRTPRWMRRVFFKLTDRIVDRVLAGPMNAVRAEFGLTTPVRGIMRDWWMSPDRVLALFPEWFAPNHGDWPPQTVLTRFPLYDESAERPMPAELGAFLKEGAPPILFTPGSANMLAREFFTVAVDACRRMNRRGLLVTQFPEQVPASLPAGVRCYDYVPFSQVFPRCAAVIHHGGIGTCAQGLAAGAPQLVMAMAHDQPDNGWRLRALGVGDYLTPKTFRGPVVAEKLARLIASPATAAACRDVKQRMAAQMPPEKVADLIEAVGR